MFASVDDVEISRAKEERMKKVKEENRALEDDLNALKSIGDMTTKLHGPHKDLDDLLRQMSNQLKRQLTERQTNITTDEIQSAYLDLRLGNDEDVAAGGGTGAAAGGTTVSLVFATAERRIIWEDVFADLKQKLARKFSSTSSSTAHTLPNAAPEFLSLIPIRKTRSGLQLTCGAPTSSQDAAGDVVWVCNSDGYVGQVCVLSLNSAEPNVICCNGVCNSRIISICTVPAAKKQCFNFPVRTAPGSKVNMRT